VDANLPLLKDRCRRLTSFQNETETDLRFFLLLTLCADRPLLIQSSLRSDAMFVYLTLAVAFLSYALLYADRQGHRELPEHRVLHTAKEGHEVLETSSVDDQTLLAYC